jgi:putative intracellular protease/amidase
MPPPKMVHVAVYEMWPDWEVGYAMAHIHSSVWQREPGRFRVVTVAASAGPVTSMGGMCILPDLLLEELRPTDSAMLILPGAYLWMTGENGNFGVKAREFLDANVAVAAIGSATLGLAYEGLLDDRHHTSDSTELLEISDYKGRSLYRDELAVTDRQLVTATSRAPVEFAREVFALLGVYDPPILASWLKMYGDQNPAGYYELAAHTLPFASA